MELEQIQRELQLLEGRLASFESALREAGAAHATLEGLVGLEGEVLLPIGAGFRVRATVTPGPVLEDVGADTVLERDPAEAAQRLGKRIEEIQAAMTQTNARAQELAMKGQQLIQAQAQG